MASLPIWKNSWEVQSITLNPKGIIDRKARRVFTNGQCHSLALAIKSIKPDWPLVGFYDWSNRKPLDPGHVVVSPYQDEYLDINGLGALERWTKKHGSISIFHLTTEQVCAKLETYLKPDPETALPFAISLLKSVGLN